MADPVVTAPWLAVAEGEIGVREVRGGENKRILDYFTATTLRASEDETPWCSAFVNWCLAQVGIEGTRSAAAASFLRWGQPAFEPTPGAIVVIRRRDAPRDPATGSPTGNHVAFYAGATKTAIRLLGGNQGDAVKYSDFPLAKYTIRQVRWPRGADRALHALRGAA